MDNDFKDLLRQKRSRLVSKDYVRFDEVEDVLASTDLISDIIPKLAKEPAYWKWVIIAAHNALQGAMVCALRDTASINILDQKSASAVLKWLNDRKGKYPKERLADFDTLLNLMLDKLQEDGQTIPTRQIGDIKTLHREFRNNFSHFVPKSWSIEKGGLPRIISAALDLIELGMKQSQVLVRMSGNQTRRLKANLIHSRSGLQSLSN